MFVGAVNLLADKVYFEPFVSSAPSILPEPPFASYFTVTLMSFQVAIRVTSPEILSILYPDSLSPSWLSIFQPANSLFLSGVNVGFGITYSSPFLTVTGSIVPVAPSFVWNVTLNSIGFQMAFITLSPFTVISSPGFLSVVSPSIIHPENSWFSGGVKVVLGGKVYVSPFFLGSSLLLPPPPFGSRVTL